MRKFHSIVLLAAVATLALTSTAPAKGLRSLAGVATPKSSKFLGKASRFQSKLMPASKMANGFVAKKSLTKARLMHRISKPGDLVSLNPQPLPPRWKTSLLKSSILSRGGAVSLNPQPLPPKALGLLVR